MTVEQISAMLSFLACLAGLGVALLFGIACILACVKSIIEIRYLSKSIKNLPKIDVYDFEDELRK